MINSLFSPFVTWSKSNIEWPSALRWGDTRKLVNPTSTTSACRAMERELKANGLRTMAMIMALGILLVAPIDPARARQAEPALRSCRWEPVFGTWVFERHPYVHGTNDPLNVDEVQRAIGTHVNFTTHLVRNGRTSGSGRFWIFGGTAKTDRGMKGTVSIGRPRSIDVWPTLSGYTDHLSYSVTIDWENGYSDSQYVPISTATLEDLEKQITPYLTISGSSSLEQTGVGTVHGGFTQSDQFTVSIPFKCVALAVRTDIWMTNNADRPGSDYAHFIAADPNECRLACYDDSTCKAWTWVKPGVQAPGPRCYLKRPAPAETPNTCCISGLGYKPELPIPRLPFP